MKVFCSLLLIGSIISLDANGEPPVEALSLSRAEGIALLNSPRIAAAYFRTQAANEAVREVRAGLFPQATLDLAAVGANMGARLGSTGGLNNPSVFNRESNGVNFTQLITDFGRTLALTSASHFEALSESERERYIHAQVLLIVDVAYFSALRAQSLLRVATETVKARGEVFEQASALAKTQIKSGLDVSFARENVAEAKLLLLQAENDVSASLANLTAALGYRETRNFKLIDEPEFPFPKAAVEVLVAEALVNRPEIVGLRDQEAAALKNVSAARAARLPKITALGSVGRTVTGDAPVEGNYTAAGVNVELPIFTGGRLSSSDREARFRASVARKQLEDEEDEVVRTVHVAWLGATTALKRITVTKEFVESASDVFSLASSRFRLGLTSIIELTQAQLSETEAQIQFASANYDYQIARAKLEFEIGGLKYRAPSPGLR